MTMLATSAPAPSAELAGTWKLAPGRAVTLRPTADGILRIASGAVWATVDGPHAHHPDASGDHVLEPGRSLFVRAGQRVVLEGWRRGDAAHFSWNPVFAPAAAPAPRVTLAALAQPLRDLRLAGGLAVHALARLALALGRLAVDVLRPGRFVPAR